MNKLLQFRNAHSNDLPEMKQLFVNTVRNTCAKDYTPEAIEVWASSVQNETRWSELIEKQWVVLALIENKIVGFASLDKGNYIDFMYVHHQYQHQGIATALLKTIENQASEPLLVSDVSITARPFFESQGFEVKAENQNYRNGILLINYKMSKIILVTKSVEI